MITFMKKHTTKLLTALLSLFVSAVMAQPTGAFMHTYEETSTGATREIACYVPENYNSTQQYPFILFWHGSGIPATEWRQYLINTCRDMNVILACPDWNELNNQEQLLEMIGNTQNYFAQNYNMDTTRYIMSGHSSGSQLAYMIGLNSPTWWKGIININPFVNVNFFAPQHWESFNTIRSAVILGSLDNNYNDVKKVVDSVAKVSNKSLYIEKAGVHHYDTVYLNSTAFTNDFKQTYQFIMGTTGLSNAASLSRNIHFYPNPAHGMITLMLIPTTEVKTLQLFSPEGRLVKTYMISAATTQLHIDINDIRPGIYQARILLSSGMQTFRLMIE